MNQDQLIDEHGAQDEPSGRGQSPGWHLTMAGKDPLELLVDVLDRQRAQRMDDATDFDVRIRRGIAARLRRHQDPLVDLPAVRQGGIVIGLVTPQEAPFGGNSGSRTGASSVSTRFAGVIRRPRGARPLRR
jgi:hypothetical protein